MARHRPAPGRDAPPPHVRGLRPLLKIIVLLLCTVLLPAAGIGFGLDSVLQPHHCDSAPMGADDPCMYAGTKGVRRPGYREELLPAAEIDTAERRRRADLVGAALDGPDQRAGRAQTDLPDLRERVEEFGRGRAVRLRDRTAQIRVNRIYGGIVIGGGAMFLLAIPLLLPQLVDDLRERRRWRSARRRHRKAG